MKYLKYAILLVYFNFAYAIEEVNITKKFTPTEAKELEKVQITLTLTNNSDNFKALNGTVTDSLPDDLKLASPLNATWTECGSPNIVGNPATNSVKVTGAEIEKSILNKPCEISFDVIAPKLDQGTTQKNIENIININNFSATLSGLLVTNRQEATATLLVKSNEVLVEHNFVFSDGTVMDGTKYYNEGEDVYLVTTLINDSYVAMTDLGFKNKFRNDIVNGVMSTVTTTCNNGNVGLNKETPSAEYDEVSLSSAVLPPKSSCEVRIKIDRTRSPYLYGYGRQYTDDYFDRCIVTTAERFSNSCIDRERAILKLVGGSLIIKEFCDVSSTDTPIRCEKQKTLVSNNNSTEQFVRVRLKNFNTKDSAFRSKFTDQLPIGMRLVSPTNFSSSCPNVTTSGSAGADFFTIDATNMPLVPNGLTVDFKLCDVYAKVIANSPKLNTPPSTWNRFSNNLFKGIDENGDELTGTTRVVREVNGGHSISPDGFSPLIYTSEFMFRLPRELEVSKRFKYSRFDNDIPTITAGENFDMVLSLVNTSNINLTDISIKDDLSHNMQYDIDGTTYHPFKFSGIKNTKIMCKKNSTDISIIGNPSLGSHSVGDQNFNFSNITVPAKSSCEITVPLILDSSMPIQSGSKVVNTIPSSDITYLVNGTGVIKTTNEDVSQEVNVKSRIRKTKKFRPSLIKSNEVSTIVITTRIYGREDSADIVDFEINDPLPTGMTIANPANAEFSCSELSPIQGVIIQAVPNSDMLSLKVDKILKNSNVNKSYNECTLKVNVKVQASYTDETYENIATYSAKEGDGALSGKVIKSDYGKLTATLKVKGLPQVGLNKSVSVEEIAVGGVVRALVTIDNSFNNAVDLTNVTLTDDLRASGSSQLSLVTPDADPTFGDDATGDQSSSNCTGGNINIDSTTKLTLANAIIKKGTKCIFAFNMTSLAGGTWINQIPANAIKTSEGITNPNTAQKSVSFTGNFLIGAKKTAKSFTENNDGTYTVTYEAGIKNHGVFPLTNIEITDKLTSDFGAHMTAYEIEQTPVFSQTSAVNTITLNPNFNGSSDLVIGSAGSLDVNEEIIISFMVKFKPKIGEYRFDNIFQVTAKNAKNETTSDDSNDVNYINTGSVSPTDNENKIPTMVSIPKIGVAKTAVKIVNNNNGTYTASYTVKIKNYSAVTLANVKVTDNLATEFMGTNYTVSTIPTIISGSGLTALSNYNGDVQDELAVGTIDTLSEVTLAYSVTFTPQVGKKTYENQALATGESNDYPALKTSDKSNNGSYEGGTPNNNPSDGADDNTPTRITLTPNVVQTSLLSSTSLMLMMLLFAYMIAYKRKSHQ